MQWLQLHFATSVNSGILTLYLMAPQWQLPLYCFSSPSFAASWEGDAAGTSISAPLNFLTSSAVRCTPSSIRAYWRLTNLTGPVGDGLTLILRDWSGGASRLRANTDEPHSGQNLAHIVSHSQDIFLDRHSPSALYLSWQTRTHGEPFHCQPQW